MKLRIKVAVLIAATSGLRTEELYKLTLNNVDLGNRTIFLEAEITKDFEDRITFFSEEAKVALLDYLKIRKSKTPRLFSESNIRRAFRQLDTNLRIKHMRKFFSQQSNILGMFTTIKKILIGYVVRNDEYLASDIDLGHYDFQDEKI